MELRTALPADPASAGRARRLTEETLREWQRDDLIDVTTLLVSELVTNAVLHAGAGIHLRLLARGARVRVEVGDLSDVLPTPRGYGREATTGRGLGLVKILASAWGAEPKASGKVVWFEVSGSEAEPWSGEDDLLAAFGDVEQPEPPALADSEVASTVTVRLLDLPIRLYRAMEQHNDALLREFALLGLAGDSGVEDGTARSPLGTTALAARLPLKTSAVEAALQQALDRDETSLDLLVQIPPDVKDVCGALLLALDEADDLARQEGLLIPAALPEIRACRQWCLSEVIAQIDGDAPTAWSSPAVRGGSETTSLAQIDPALVLHSLNDGVIVGDDQNRILYLNPAAERLLGWSSAELRGQRLTAIVPPQLHEAHIVGYSRYLVTRHPHLIGQPVRVPALHRDGREIPVELMLGTFPSTSGRPAFVAALRDVSDRQERERTVTTASALSAISDVAALFGGPRAATDLEVAAPSVLASVGRHLGCRAGLLWNVQAAEEEMASGASWDDGSDSGAAFRTASLQRRFRAGVGIPGRVWVSGQPLWIADLVSDANFQRANLALECGLRSALAFPVVTGTEVRGAIEFFSSEVLDVNADVMAIVAAMGRQLGAHARGSAPA